ncbi:MAG: ABC transporter permease subunit [Proteobacteria bacterium]|nr:ABC transporter permease subunit [Pseudomonadota bacterium]
MGAYIVKRIASALLILFLDVVLVFSLIHLTPGDPALMIVSGEMGVATENVEAVRRELGLDKPLPVQFYDYLRGLLRGDMGRSFFNNEPVFEMLVARIPMTFTLALVAMLIGLVIAIPSGILAAVKRGSIWDQVFMFLAMFGVSMPAFWLALILMLIFAVQLGWFPVVGYASFFKNPFQWIRHLALPALAIGFAQSALKARMTRSSLLEVLRQDYVALTARAKGLPRWKVIIKHALPNAAFPIVTVVGMSFAYLLGGVVIIEMVFALPGVGNLLIDSVARRDYHVIQGVLLFIATANVVMNLLVDISYAMIDRRVRYGLEEGGT